MCATTSRYSSLLIFSPALSESIAAETAGVDLTISMNAKYLLDSLRALEEDDVQISFNGAVSPFILQNREKKESLYLILPVRNVA